MGGFFSGSFYSWGQGVKLGHLSTTFWDYARNLKFGMYTCSFKEETLE